MAPRRPGPGPQGSARESFSLYNDVSPVRGRFISRRDRFTVRCAPEGSEESWAHLPNPGRLWEHLIPGATLRLLPARRGGMPWRVVGVDAPEGTVMLDTIRSNEAVRWLLEHRLVPGFEEARVVRSEAVHGDSRFDFELEEGGKPLFLEVKSCTLFSGGVAMFPDAPTERGRRHLEGLAALASRGTPGGVLFLIQSAAVRGFLPDFHTDPAFAEAFAACAPRLRVRALGVDWTPELSLRLPGRPVPFLRDTLLRENHDRGTLLEALSPKAPVPFDLGERGTMLEPGHYVYGEDLPQGLHQAARRRRRGFALRLRGAPDPGASTATPLPIRSSTPLAEEAFRRLAPLGEVLLRQTDPGSFLVRLPIPPLAHRAVVDLLFFLRMGRLAPPEEGPSGGFR